MKICVVTGSRADFGPLEWLVKKLAEHFPEVKLVRCWNYGFAQAFTDMGHRLEQDKPEMVLVLGDRYEILACVIASHLQRIPIAHIGGGDVTRGSYDDVMRDCISRMATLHFTTSKESQERLWKLGCLNVHMVGSPGVDYIMHGDWERERPIAEPYVVVSYQPETIDGTTEWDKVLTAIRARRAIVVPPNPDRGSKELHLQMILDQKSWPNLSVWESQSHTEFLNLLHHCEEFIGNSSAMFYEAPFMGVKTRVIGKRQSGRVVPFGDGNASGRIIAILKQWKP